MLTRIVLAMAIPILAVVSNGGAQGARPSHQSPFVSARIEVDDAFRGKSGFRFFDVPLEFEIRVVVVNYSGSPVLVDVRAFADRLRVALEGSTTPLNARWITPAIPDGASKTSATVLRLRPEEGRFFRGQLSAANGAFRVGAFTLRVSLSAAMATIVSESGERLTPHGDAVAPLDILPPRNADEQRIAYQHAATNALFHHRLEEAERFSKLLTDSDASSSTGLSVLGRVYLQRKNYRAAVQIFERLLNDSRQKELGLIPQLLAEAYVGAGNDSAAVRTLERLGYRHAVLAKELTRLRQIVSSR
jgi:hypothetical protein